MSHYECKNCGYLHCRCDEASELEKRIENAKALLEAENKRINTINQAKRLLYKMGIEYHMVEQE